MTACSSSKSERDSVINQVIQDRKVHGDIQQNNTVAEESNTSNKEENITQAPSSWYELEQLGPYGPVKKSYNDIKEQYPNKSILTVAWNAPSDFITDALNNYLLQNGTDYVVYFLERTLENSKAFSSIDENNSIQYEEKKQAIIEIMDTTDIIYLDRIMFYDFAKMGYLAEWGNFLTTDNGKKLYQSMSENNWKTCMVDDEIYGVNGRSDLVFGPPSYIINKELMIKYNITEEDLNKPIYEIGEILKAVAEGEKANDNFKPLALDSAEWFNVFNNSVYLNSRSVALYNDLSKKVGSVLDEPENLHWLEALCHYANQGLVGKVSKQLDDFFIKINIRSTLPYMIPDYMSLYNKDGELINAEDVIEIVLDKYYDGSLCWIGITSVYANCIPASSKHIDEAFDFLMRLYTDPYLTNLLTYGIENKTYIMKDNKVEWPDIYYLGSGNSYISYPRNYEYADKKDRYWRLNESLPYVYYDFVFDPSNVMEELEKTNNIMDNVSKILTGKVEDFDAFIDDIRKQLNENGLPKLLDEIDRQRDAWINSKAAKED